MYDVASFRHIGKQHNLALAAATAAVQVCVTVKKSAR